MPAGRGAEPGRVEGEQVSGSSRRLASFMRCGICADGQSVGVDLMDREQNVFAHGHMAVDEAMSFSETFATAVAELRESIAAGEPTGEPTSWLATVEAGPEFTAVEVIMRTAVEVERELDTMVTAPDLAMAATCALIVDEAGPSPDAWRTIVAKCKVEFERTLVAYFKEANGEHDVER